MSGTAGSRAATLLTPRYLAQLARWPGLPGQTYYIVTGVTLSALNRPSEIPAVFSHALKECSGSHGGSSGGHEEAAQIAVARRLREGLVKSAAIVGLPKTINALLALKSSTPSHLLDEEMGVSERAVELRSGDAATILKRGQDFFDKLYGKVAGRVMGQMDRCGTEDLGVTARLMYGYVLSNTHVLSPAESSFVLLAGLIPQDVNPQLKGHLKGALNNGATLEEVRAVRNLVIDICEKAGMVHLDAGQGAETPGHGREHEHEHVGSSKEQQGVEVPEIQRAQGNRTGIWREEIAKL